MTFWNTIDNNFIVSVYTSRVIFLIKLRHDGMLFFIHLFILPFLPQDEINGWTSIKPSVQELKKKKTGCAKDKAYLAARSPWSYSLISVWLSIKQIMIYFPLANISWYVCRRYLQNDSYSLGYNGL